MQMGLFHLWPLIPNSVHNSCLKSLELWTNKHTFKYKKPHNLERTTKSWWWLIFVLWIWLEYTVKLLHVLAICFYICSKVSWVNTTVTFTSRLTNQERLEDDKDSEFKCPFNQNDLDDLATVYTKFLTFRLKERNLDIADIKSHRAKNGVWLCHGNGRVLDTNTCT